MPPLSMLFSSFFLPFFVQWGWGWERKRKGRKGKRKGKAFYWGLVLVCFELVVEEEGKGKDELLNRMISILLLTFSMYVCLTLWVSLSCD